MKSFTKLAWLITGLMTGACHQAAPRKFDSVVGAKSLPDPGQLSNETIQINRRGGPRNDHVLTYDLPPNNSLTVTYVIDRAGGGKTVAKAVFGLSPEIANGVRSQLRRLRPERLTGLQDITLPAGCQVVIDASPQGNVVFIDRHQALGISSIPREHDCNTPQASEARGILADVLTILPGSGVTAKFPE